LTNYFYQKIFPIYHRHYRLQAISISALSKICIEKEDLAKKIVPAFGSLLEKTKDTVIKQSIICSLADMCMRHANVVEPYLPQILAKLQDPEKRVKRETLLQLVRLSRVSWTHSQMIGDCFNSRFSF